MSSFLPRRKVPALFSRRKPAGSAGVHIVDTFTGTTGTSLEAHTPDTNTPGNAWTNLYGVWKIDTNQARADLQSGSATVMIDTGVSELTVSAYHIGNASGLLLRAVDNDNFWLGYDQGAYIYLYEKTNAWLLRGVSAVIPALPHTLTFSAYGDQLVADVDGVSISFTSSVRITATKAGLYAESPAIQFDDFEVIP